jgi:tRNA(Ile)-lysidine synthase
VTDRPGPLPAGLDRPALLAAVSEDLAVLPAGAAVVVALSGGPDSTALAYLATEARPDLDVTLAHVRHGLRDDRDDVAVVERHAAYLGAPLETVAVTVRRSGHGTAAAARAARYDALRAVADRVGACAILVGHSADDQAETVLLRAARGTGVTGLAAMAPETGDLVRPLLRLRRADLRRFVALEGLPVATDPTNADPDQRRVAVRTHVLPALREVGADPVGALGRLAALAGADDDALDAYAGAALERAAVRTGAVVALRDAALADLHPAVRRRVWRRVLLAVSGEALPPGSAVIARIESLAPGRRVVLGDVEVTAGGGWSAVAPRAVATAAETPVLVPGTTPWAPAGVEVRARTPDGSPGAGAPPGQIAFELTGAWSPPRPAASELAVPPGGVAARCALRVAAGVGPLVVRHRRAGDRCHTRVGTQRVADLLVDAKVPRPVRDRWPLVAAGDRVVWLPGVAADAEVLAAGRADPAVQLVVTPTRPV